MSSIALPLAECAGPIAHVFEPGVNSSSARATGFAALSIARTSVFMRSREPM